MITLSAYHIIFLIILWICGGITIITLIAKTERKRLGGKLYSHIVDDIQESPLPALLGYSLMFTFSWISVIFHYAHEASINQKQL